MIRNRNIICIASNWWYDPTSKHQVMKLLAEENDVVWVNYHGSRRPRVGAADVRAAATKIRQIIEGPRRVAPRITVITPLVVPAPGNRAAKAMNHRLLTWQIRSVLRTLPPRPVQLWTFAPDVDYLVGGFDEECAVYYCVDEFAEFSGYDRDAIAAAETRLAARADLIVVTSQALLESKRRLHKNVHLVPHGVDIDHFARAGDEESPMPEDVAALPQPILGFWGLIQDWVDVELLAAVARARPQWSLALLGDAATDVSALAALPNVHLLGRRPYARLPAYASAMDVGLIPFRVNDLTRAVNPIKLREYLSAGLPVVSTPLPEVERYAEWVRTASTPEAFILACEAAIDDGAPAQAEARRAAMRGETWRARVEQISELVVATGRRSARHAITAE